jgi:serine/threonine protein kinase/serine phosphatase RsbU (regulator of sigma subunit)
VRRDQSDYALKIIRPEHTHLQEKANAFAFAEGATLVRLRHQNLVQVHEIGKSGNETYILMDFINGQPFSEVILERKLTESTIVSIFKQIVSALAQVHDHGIVHRDLKPANVLLEKTGRAVLIDFGLASEVSKLGMNSEFVGSYLFCSPEQCGLLQRPVDMRSDLYAIGAMLYAAAAQVPPFPGDDAGLVMHQHATKKPADIQTLNPDISSGLAAIIHCLLSKDPDDRYQHCKALLEDLDRIAEISQNIASLGAAKLRTGSTDDLDHRDTQLVGRDPELKELKAAFTRTRDHKKEVALLVGEPGSGKSRLAREVLAFGAKQNALILKGKCSESDPVPFSVFRASLEAFMTDISRQPEAQRLKKEQVILSAIPLGTDNILKRIVPSIGKLLSSSKVNSTASSQEQVFSTFAEFLTNLSTSGHFQGLILFIDDIQWVDPASRDFLNYLVKSTTKAPLFIVCAARNDIGSRNKLEEFEQAVRGSVTVRHVLGDLRLNDVTKILEHRLGAAIADSELAENLLQRSRGNPFALHEFIRNLLELGALRYSWGVWTFESSVFEALNLPTDLVQLVLKRVDGLEKDSRDVLAMSALVGGHFTAKLLEDIFSKQSFSVTKAFDQGLANGFIERSEDGRLRFVHDKIREALLSGFTPETKKTAHLAIAEAFERHPLAEDEWIYGLARHYLASDVLERPELALIAVMRAGETALNSYAYQNSYVFLKEAVSLEVSLHGKNTFKLLFTTGNAAFKANLLAESGNLFLQAITSATKKADKAKVRSILSRVYLAAYDSKNALEQALTGLKELGWSVPKNPVMRFMQTAFLFLLGTILGGKLKRWVKVSAATKEKASIAIYLNHRAGHAAYFNLEDSIRMHTKLRNAFFASIADSPRDIASHHFSIGVFWANLGIRWIANNHFKRAKLLVEASNDHALAAECEFWEAVSQDMGGDPVVAVKMYRNLLTKYEKWLDYSLYSDGCVMTYNILMTQGYVSEANVWSQAGERRFEQSDKASNAASGLVFSRKAAVESMLGNKEESEWALDMAKDIASKVPSSRRAWGRSCHLWISFLLGKSTNRNEIKAIEELWHTMVKMPPTWMPNHMNYYFYFRAQAWIEAYFNSDDSAKSDCIAGLRIAAKDLWVCRRTPLYRVLHEFVETVFLFDQRRFDQCLLKLDRVESAAARFDSPWVTISIWRLRAFIWRKKGILFTSDRYARTAVQLAHQVGLRFLARKIGEDFSMELVKESSRRDQSSRMSNFRASYMGSALSGTESTLMKPKSTQIEWRYNALLESSLASTKLLDFKEQARVALTGVTRVLKAERAALFLVDKTSGLLNLSYSIDSEGKETETLMAYSTTVVERVRVGLAPVLVTGSADGSLVESESIVAHDLRSILCVPLILNNALIGCVYIDNNLIRGVFGNDDADVLLGISNHIALAMETARAANLEMEHQVLSRDLEVTGAIQSLLLPQAASMKTDLFALDSMYQSAQQSGGDWWSLYQPREDYLLIFIGDVTGHGVGAAMITATIAGAYHSLNTMFAGTNDIGQAVMSLLSKLNTTIDMVSVGRFWMTFSVVGIDFKSNTIQFWNAGGLPVLNFKKSGSCETIIARGMPLGSGDIEVGTVVKSFEVGDRLIIHTDGVNEMEGPGEKILGNRLWRAIIKKLQPIANPQVLVEMKKELESFRKLVPLNDDYTVIVIDLLATKATVNLVDVDVA